MRAEKNDQSREKPIQALETYGYKKQHRKRQHKRDLHSQALETVCLLTDGATGRETQQNMRDRKNEEFANDDGQE